MLFFASVAFRSQHIENGLEVYQCRSQKTKLSLTAWLKGLVMAWFIRQGRRANSWLAYCKTFKH